MKRFLGNVEPTLPSSVLDAALDLWSQTKRRHWIPVSGNSMFPLIREQDRLLVTHGCGDVRQGAIVVFRREGELIAHRVMRFVSGKSGRVFVTKGDNVSEFDPAFPDDQIVGKVLGIKRNNKYMSLDTPSWQMLGQVIVFATLASMRLSNWGSRLKRKFFGARPSRIARFLRRCLRTGSFCVRRAMQAVAVWSTCK